MDVVEGAFKQIDSYDVILALAELVRETAVFRTISFRDLQQSHQITLLLEMLGTEIDDGGFYQLLTNPTGDYLPQILQTCEIIGARRMAVLLQSAILLFPSMTVLRNTEARQNWIESSGWRTKETLAILDKSYLTQLEEVFDLGVIYLREYKADFRSLDDEPISLQGEEEEE